MLISFTNDVKHSERAQQAMERMGRIISQYVKGTETRSWILILFPLSTSPFYT